MTQEIKLPRGCIKASILDEAFKQKLEFEKKGLKIVGYTSNGANYTESISSLHPICASTTWRQVSDAVRGHTPIGQQIFIDPVLKDAVYKKDGTNSSILSVFYSGNIESLRNYQSFQLALSTTLRFIRNDSCYLAGHCKGDGNFFNFGIIHLPPAEAMEGDTTYRTIWRDNSPAYSNNDSVRWCAPHTAPEYNYLDAGNFIGIIPYKKEKKVVISQTFDVDSLLIMVLLCFMPEATKQLEQGFLIPSRHRKLLRIKLERAFEDQVKKDSDELEKKAKAAEKLTSEEQEEADRDDYSDPRTLESVQDLLAEYKSFRGCVENDYLQSLEMTLVGKILRGEVESGTFNDVKVFKNKAVYRTVSIEYPDLAETATRLLTNKQEPSDIYGIVDYICAYTAAQVNSASDVYTSPTITINGIPIVVTKNPYSIRHVNGVRINAAEIKDVMVHAACLNSEAEYKNFLEQVSQLSLRWCNVLIDGLGVKIHALTHDDRYSPTPSRSAPRLKFIRDGAKIYLVCRDGVNVRIRLGECIERIDVLNRQTDGSWSRSSGAYRNMEWAQDQLKRILKKCCTFDKTTTTVLDGVESKTTQTICTITDAQCDELPSVLREQHEKAVKKSEEFLAQAVSVTGSVVVDWKGQEAFEVKGNICEYVVIKEDAKVYDKKTGKYICIVDPQTYDGVGYDRVAARLYALKNDAASSADIHTIRENQKANHQEEAAV